MGSTNYTGTFIQVAEDCPAEEGEQPPVGGKAPTIAALQYALISAHPYEFTSDDVLFEVHAIRQSLPAEVRPAAREAYFAKDQACLRSSPLGKRYGWVSTTTTQAASRSCHSTRTSTGPFRRIRRSSSSRPCARSAPDRTALLPAVFHYVLRDRH